MTRSKTEKLRIDVATGGSVSALAQAGSNAQGCLVLAHGAGAGMDHAFMRAAADGLAERHIATFRFQFPYMESGSKRPDRPPVAHATIRAAVAAAAEVFPGLPLLAGGKSFGGRMTSQTQAIAPMALVRALVFFGFPLHPSRKPSSERAHHLSDIRVPMLFIQGTRDKLAEFHRIEDLVELLAPRARLLEIEQADHSFHVPVRAARTDTEVLEQMLDATAAFVLQQHG